MKKLLIIITLFVSSFFLFCNKEVKADSLTYTYTSFTDYYSEYEITKRAAAEAYAEKNSKPYYILGINGNYFIDVAPTRIYFTDSSITLVIPGSFKLSSCAYTSTNGFHACAGTSSQNNYSISSSSLSNHSKLQYAMKYTNVLDLKLSTTTSNIYSSVIWQYEDFTYEVVQGDVFISAYDFFNLYTEYKNTEQENPHQEEIDKVTNFYTMVIEKIEYLANEISNNYILLFVIGIFIVTFIFLLIFRRFL